MTLREDLIISLIDFYAGEHSNSSRMLNRHSTSRAACPLLSIRSSLNSRKRTSMTNPKLLLMELSLLNRMFSELYKPDSKVVDLMQEYMATRKTLVEADIVQFRKTLVGRGNSLVEQLVQGEFYDDLLLLLFKIATMSHTALAHRKDDATISLYLESFSAVLAALESIKVPSAPSMPQDITPLPMRVVAFGSISVEIPAYASYLCVDHEGTVWASSEPPTCVTNTTTSWTDTTKRWRLPRDVTLWNCNPGMVFHISESA